MGSVLTIDSWGTSEPYPPPRFPPRKTRNPTKGSGGASKQSGAPRMGEGGSTTRGLSADGADLRRSRKGVPRSARNIQLCGGEICKKAQSVRGERFGPPLQGFCIFGWFTQTAGLGWHQAAPLVLGYAGWVPVRKKAPDFHPGPVPMTVLKHKPMACPWAAGSHRCPQSCRATPAGRGPK